MDYCRYVWRFVYYFPRKWQKCQKKKKDPAHLRKVRKNSWTLLLSGSPPEVNRVLFWAQIQVLWKICSVFFCFFCVCVCDKNTNNQQWQTTQNKQTDKQTNRHGWQHNLTGGGNKHIHLLPLSSLVLSHPYRAGRGSRNGAKIFSSQLLTPTFLHFWTATNPCMWFADSGHRSLTWMHF